ncbi:MAG: hypothetical protein KTR20_08040 [Cellvibrionaceae bacterium]|nr:hypothetical protein [Cellvibrionaceae bacterium]
MKERETIDKSKQTSTITPVYTDITADREPVILDARRVSRAEMANCGVDKAYEKQLSTIVKGAKKITKVMNGVPFEVSEDASLDLVVPKDVQSITADNGQEITRKDFSTSAVPKDFTTNLNSIKKGGARQALLKQEVKLLQGLVDEYEPMKNGRRRIVKLEADGQLLLMRNFPLPDGYTPDKVDIMLDLVNYPARPPIGMYLLTKNNQEIIQRIKTIFGNHIFTDSVYYNIKKYPNFTWICHHYANHRWSLNASSLHQGDNLRKFMEVFLARV